MKNEQKNNKEKINFILFLIASICFYIVAIINFIDNNISTAVTFFCVGSVFLCLSFTHLDKDKNNE